PVSSSLHSDAVIQDHTSLWLDTRIELPLSAWHLNLLDLPAVDMPAEMAAQISVRYVCPSGTLVSGSRAVENTCSGEPRFGIGFVSSCGHGNETHQSGQITAAD